MSIWDCGGNDFLDELIKSGGLLAGIRRLRDENRPPTSRDGRLCKCGVRIGYRSKRCEPCRRKWLVDSNRARLSPHQLSSAKANQTHCKRGHIFSDENTYYCPEVGGALKRFCRPCRRLREADKRARHRAQSQRSSPTASEMKATAEVKV